jgi:hypothetical protein
MMVRALLSLSETPEPADAADALAVALCHIQADQARVRFGVPATGAARGRAGRPTRRDSRETPVGVAGI